MWSAFSERYRDRCLMAVILGIDPGTRIVGWGAIEASGSSIRLIDAGCIDVRRVESIPARFKAIYEGLASVLNAVKPAEAVFEKAFTGINPASGIRIGEGRGVAIVCAVNLGIRVTEYSPAEVKKAVTGRGAAPKEQVQEMVRRILGLERRPQPDAADALAVAICGANRRA